MALDRCHPKSLNLEPLEFRCYFGNYGLEDSEYISRFGIDWRKPDGPLCAGFVLIHQQVYPLSMPPLELKRSTLSYLYDYEDLPYEAKIQDGDISFHRYRVEPSDYDLGNIHELLRMHLPTVDDPALQNAISEQQRINLMYSHNLRVDASASVPMCAIPDTHNGLSVPYIIKSMISSGELPPNYLDLSPEDKALARDGKYVPPPPPRAPPSSPQREGPTTPTNGLMPDISVDLSIPPELSVFFTTIIGALFSRFRTADEDVTFSSESGSISGSYIRSGNISSLHIVGFGGTLNASFDGVCTAIDYHRVRDRWKQKGDLEVIGELRKKIEKHRTIPAEQLGQNHLIAAAYVADRFPP